MTRRWSQGTESNCLAIRFNHEFRDDIKCVCPDGHNYLDTKYNFDMEGEDAIVEIDYYCLPVSSFRHKFTNLKATLLVTNVQHNSVL